MVGLSNISTLGTRTFVSGGASGINTEALITVAYNIRKREADTIDLNITKNTTKSTAYSKLQSLSQAVQTSLASLRKSYSVLNSASSTFDARTGSLSSSSTTPAQSLVEVAIAPGTTLGSFEIEVQRKAQAHKVGGNSLTTDKAAPLSYTGTFDIGLAGGATSSVNITAGMSLTDVAATINATTTTSGVTASVLKTGATGYQLILTGNQTNKNIAVTNITGTDVLQSLGVLNGGGGFANPIQVAQDALITLDGTPVTRDNNDFSDLIDGVSLTVKNSEIGTKIQLKVENDTSALSSAITTFVTAYNSLRDFITINQTENKGVVSADAVLFGDFTMKNIGGDIQKLLADSYGDSSTKYTTLRAAGITIDGDNHLVIDTAKLEEAMSTKFDEIKALFQTAVTSDNTNFRMSGNTSKTKTLSAAIDITYSGGAVTAASVGGDTSLFTVSGGTITGNVGTAYEGLKFAYVGTTSTTVNFTMKQGLSDLLSNRIDKDTNVVTGSIQALKIGIDAQNTKMSARATRVLERADDYRQKLIDKYAGYEARIARAQTTLSQIKAIVNANNNN